MPKLGCLGTAIDIVNGAFGMKAVFLYCALVIVALAGWLYGDQLRAWGSAHVWLIVLPVAFAVAGWLSWIGEAVHRIEAQIERLNAHICSLEERFTIDDDDEAE